MQVLIDIPENVIAAVRRMGLLRVPDEMQKIVDKAIQHGKPLPEEHGRLGDLDELEQRISNYIEHNEHMMDELTLLQEKFILEGIKDTPTIIEANKAEGD